MEHMAWKGRIKPGCKAEYQKRHAEIWPEMVKVLKDAGICNYSIFYCNDELFGYYECEKGVAYAEKVQAEVRARIDQAWNYLKLDMGLGKTPEEAVARLPEGTDIRRVIEAMGGPSRLIATGERTFGDGTVKTYEYYNYDGFKSAYETIIRQTSALNSGPRKAVGPGMKQIGGKT